ncbi:MAG TPA: hypothetical protein VKN64_08855 [Halanaerobiales bacterium]|nr:hypothetical protein [Halanaerobiales bacterium]
MEVAKKEKSSHIGTCEQRDNYSTLNNSISLNMRFCKVLFDNLEGYVEIAELKNGKMPKQYYNSVEELKEYDPPQDKDVFLGVFSRKYPSGKIEAVNQTNAIWLDFDNISDPAALEYILDNKALPEPSIVVNSGHGLHAYWLLDKPAGREVRPVVKKLINITGADPKGVNENRLMRIPGTINNKKEPVKCEVIQMTDRSFKLDHIADLLGVKAELKDKSKNVAEALNIDYEVIRNNVKSPCIKNIMGGVPEGERNWLLGRLTKYLKHKLDLSKKDARKVIRVWNTKNNPPQPEGELLASFNEYWHNKKYNLLGCFIKDKEGNPIPQLQQILEKYCNRDNCNSDGQIEFVDGESIVEFNNRLINKIKNISVNSFIIYSILSQNEQGLSAKKAANIMGVSQKTFKRNIGELIKLGYAKKKKGIPQRKIPDLYYFTKQGTFGLSNTVIRYATMRAMLAELRNGDIRPLDIKIYILLRYYRKRSLINKAYPSTTTLAEKLGTTRAEISKRVNHLERRDYFRIERGKYRSNLYKFKFDSNKKN